jgi:phenylalanyl-tRNA synthetase beta subunit
MIYVFDIPSSFHSFIHSLSLYLNIYNYHLGAYQLVRQVGGDIVESVELIDQFTHPKV